MISLNIYLSIYKDGGPPMRIRSRLTYHTLGVYDYLNYNRIIESLNKRYEKGLIDIVDINRLCDIGDIGGSYYKHVGVCNLKRVRRTLIGYICPEFKIDIDIDILDIKEEYLYTNLYIVGIRMLGPKIILIISTSKDYTL